MTYTSSWFIIKCTVKSFIVAIFLKKSVLMCINIIKSGWHGSLNTSLFVCACMCVYVGIQKLQSLDFKRPSHILSSEKVLIHYLQKRWDTPARTVYTQSKLTVHREKGLKTISPQWIHSDVVLQQESSMPALVKPVNY